MTVQVNGRPRELPDGATVAQLLQALEIGAQRVAVEVNQTLVVKKQWETTALRAGDKIEVVTFVGGG